MGLLHKECDHDVKVTFEVDSQGTDEWTTLNSVNVPVKKGVSHLVSDRDPGEWIRARVSTPAKLSVQFSYNDVENRNEDPNGIFYGLRPIAQSAYKAGLLYWLGKNRRAPGFAATTVAPGTSKSAGSYELGEQLKLVKK